MLLVPQLFSSQVIHSQLCPLVHPLADITLALSAVRDWFDKKRGTAFGICATGSSLGGVIFPIMLTRLVSEVGYAWAMRTSAFLILFLLIIANITVRQRIKHHKLASAAAKPDYLAPFREVPMVFLMTGFFLITFGIFIPIDYIVVEANAAGVSSHIRGYIVPILNAARCVSHYPFCSTYND